MLMATVAAILATAATLPATASNDGEKTPSAIQPIKEKRICVKEAAMGSQISRRVCHTAAQWRTIRTKATRKVEEWSEHPTQNGELPPH